MKKCVFVVPTHVMHFEHAYKLRDTFSKVDLNADLLFVLSNKHESDRFENGTAQKCFLLDDFPRGVDGRGIITVKKLQGVDTAIRLGYEYAIVLDCETTFTRSYNAYEVAKYLSERKQVYSSITNHNILIQINRAAADFFSEEDREKLKIITKNFTEYFWFNDIPFYDLKKCRSFFEKMYSNGVESFYARMSSAHFDHIIYIYYCLLYEDYEIVNLNEKIDLPISPSSNFHLGILESLGDRSTRDIIPRDVAQKIINETNPFWMPYGTDLTSKVSFMLFHYDRA